MERLFKGIQYLKGVGPRRSQHLARLGINTIFDLLWHVPRAYFDQGQVKRIVDLVEGEKASLQGQVMAVEKRATRRGRSFFKALIQDSSAVIPAVWFNQGFLSKVIQPGMQIFVSGRLNNYGGRQEFYVSEHELMDEENPTGRILPVYPLTEGISQKALRTLMLMVLQEYLQDYPEILDPSVRSRFQLCDIAYALYNIHFPANAQAYKLARSRLALEELYLFQHRLWEERQRWRVSGISHRDNGLLITKIKSRLPFALTPAQERVFRDISLDMEAEYPMNRLLQGDVGSGKTVVAILAMSKAAAGGHQAVMMAPTEILARQHLAALQAYLNLSGISCACLTGGTPAAERRVILQAAADGSLDILVGTQALLQENMVFSNLGLVVIDEQHRFGVKQRARLSSKGKNPDLLVMTATPIPRTLALTLYGDLDLTVIDQMPPGRKPVKTHLIKDSRRAEVYDYIRKVLLASQNSQVYIVCPLVEESEAQDLMAAETLYAELREHALAGIEVGLLHGRLKAVDKERVMGHFKTGGIKALVSTTVIEVGVDVPQATIMVVEHADRFGLSQLHQLRGRVGRGLQQSYCFLLADPHTREAWQRLRAMERCGDGFELAQEDLAIRGPGEFWGLKQHGLNQLKVASLTRDSRLAELSCQLVREGNNFYPCLHEYFIKKFQWSPEIASN
ncbi:MAG TPA: ATP-dependent DNA helicase RecG [Syntrophomonadaceae bacterium]|nr:ATP-dependent DNA helicase RecG [Syntrophomonadaceae bacterium]